MALHPCSFAGSAVFSFRHLAAIVASIGIFGEAVLAQTTSPLSPAPLSAAPLERALTPAAPAIAPAQPRQTAPRPAPATAVQPAPAANAAAPAATTPPANVAPPAAAAGQAAKPKPKPKPAPVRELALPNDPTPALQPETFFATAKASERYAAIADGGGWPVIAAALSPGAKGAPVEVLRQRLAIEGDLSPTAATGEIWTPELTEAVKRFQFRVGLKQTGAVTGKTLKAINVPAAVRFRQLTSSAQRIAGLDFAFGSRYVVVNIPSAYVEAVENGRVVRRYVAVVGDVKHPSPMVTTRVVNINLNPTWTAPTSIIKNEIIPKMKKDPGYLARARIRILDNTGAEIDPASINWSSTQAAGYTLRQDAGNANALGNIRINMPNKDAVYMHDTPSKRFFNSDYRFQSHGCVRVENVFDFAEWLLKETPGNWTKASMLAVVQSQKRQDVRLSQPVPVTWVYMTGWASEEGVVHFRDDVYNLDRIGGSRTADAR